MAKLTLTAAQVVQLATQDTSMQSAFSDGVDGPGGDILSPFEGYSDLKSSLQTLTKDTFKSALASFMVAMGLPGQSTTISYRKSDGVTNGTMTFVNGILVSST